MTPQIATVLVALIALMIGVAFKFNINRNWTQIGVPFGAGRRLTLFTRTWIAGISAAGAFVALGAGLVSIGHLVDLHHIAGLLGASGVLFGTVGLNWLWPATGATGPTAAQVENQDSVAVDVTTDGTATTTTLTHNLNISAADLAFGFPDVIITPNGASGIPATLLIVQSTTSANAVVLTFAAVVGTFRVKIKRPFSMGR